jgi:catechol 2,3-dioxygenase-like lactoylglutathione lyase family enzyme
MAQGSEKYNVGGVIYPRPFKIRRLGHFGFNVANFTSSIDFYGPLLGLRASDVVDLADIPVFSEAVKTMGDSRVFFFSHCTDHHAFILAHKSMGKLFGDDAISPDITLNQITWQVGTLEEVVNAADFLRKHDVKLRRTGRDMPGSNWHCYFHDPDGLTVELYYGMEQIGWDGRSKPGPMHMRRFDDTPTLPQISELQEVENAVAEGVDIFAGNARQDRSKQSYNVGGVLLPRPFKVTSIGPMALFVNDVAASEAFYTEMLGFTKTEEVRWRGQRCVFLRNGTEHHSLKLVPKALRETLGLSAHSNCMSVGIEVGTYQQLRDAVAYLRKQGVRFVDSVPPDLSPGIDYSAHMLDPEGHALQLYCYMEQIGWDGKPRPADMRRTVGAEWPELVEPLSDTYADQRFMGPLG